MERPSSWGTFGDGFSDVIIRLNVVCHAMMSYTPKGADTLLTACPKRDKLSLDYINWLIRGPFRSYQDKISLEKHGKDYIIRCANLGEWPANILFNFCVATRVPIEHRAILERWGKLVDAGCDENLAGALSWYAVTDLDTKLGSMVDYYNRSNHFWYDRPAKLENIVYGLFESSKVSVSFKLKPNAVAPSNVIWGHHIPTNRDKTVREIQDELGLAPVPPEIIKTDHDLDMEIIKKHQYIAHFEEVLIGQDLGGGGMLCRNLIKCFPR